MVERMVPLYGSKIDNNNICTLYIKHNSWFYPIKRIVRTNSTKMSSWRQYLTSTYLIIDTCGLPRFITSSLWIYSMLIGLGRETTHWCFITRLIMQGNSVKIAERTRTLWRHGTDLNILTWARVTGIMVRSDAYKRINSITKIKYLRLSRYVKYDRLSALAIDYRYKSIIASAVAPGAPSWW